jgi:membrane fusion protein, multidrug efflux system
VKARSAIALGLGIVFLGAGAAYLAASRSRGASEAPATADAAIPVEAGEVSNKDVPILINALGTVTPIETVAVQSRVNGQIMKAFFQQGQVVKEGDPLFLIDPRPYQAAFDQAQAQLEHDQALSAEASTDLARYQKLQAENSIAEQKTEDQAFVVQQDQGTVKLDQANVETAKLNLEYAHINSPVTGIAGAMAVDPGNYVAAGAGTTLVTVTQISPIYVTFPIPQSDLSEVRAAQDKAPLDVHALSQEGKELGDGKLTFINNEVVAATGTVMLYATFPNDNEALWPGEFVTVDLVVGVRQNALTAPIGSVVSGPEGDYVYTISADNVVTRVPVVVEARQSGLAVFTKGVSPGERVVVNGQYNLANGVKVAIQPPKAPASDAK